MRGGLSKYRIKTGSRNGGRRRKTKSSEYVHGHDFRHFRSHAGSNERSRYAESASDSADDFERPDARDGNLSDSAGGRRRGIYLSAHYSGRYRIKEVQGKHICGDGNCGGSALSESDGGIFRRGGAYVSKDSGGACKLHCFCDSDHYLGISAVKAGESA